MQPTQHVTHPLSKFHTKYENRSYLQSPLVVIFTLAMLEMQIIAIPISVYELKARKALYPPLLPHHVE